MTSTTRGGWGRWLPGVGVLCGYRRDWLRGDVLGGLTVTAYAVPQVMAYAQIAGLPPVVGLWGMLAPLAVYALMGSSRLLSVGPEATTALMTASALGAVLGTTEEHLRPGVAQTLAVLVGLVCVVSWLLRLGFLANLLSRPVMQGYLVGVAVLMVCSQLGKVTGLRIDSDQPVGQVSSLIAHLDQVHPPTLGLASATLVALLVLRRVAPRWPGPLLALAAAAALVAWAPGRGWGVATIGVVPLGLPVPHLPALEGVDVIALLPWAVGIALLGYSDNVLTGRAFALRHDQRIDAGQELAALGVANVAAGLTGGFPCSSSGSRTVLGDAMGARTQVSGLVVGIGIVGVLLVAGPALSSFPMAAMGAIIVYAASRLVDIAELRRLARFRLGELVLAAVTAAGVVTLGVLAGIGLAVTLSLLDLIRRIAHPHDAVLGYVPGLAGMHDVADFRGTEQVEGLVVYRYDAPLFFANSADFLTRALSAVAAAPTPVRWVVLNLETAVEIDLTAVDTIAELRGVLARDGIVLALARVKFETWTALSATGVIAAIGPTRVYATLPTAVLAYADDFAAEHGRPPTGLGNGNGLGPKPGGGSATQRG